MGYDKKRRETLCGTGFRVKIWCNSEPCGVICAALTWIFILFAEYCVIGVVLYPWLGPSFQMAVHSTLFSIIAFLGLASHGKAMLTDPGSVPENAIPIALAMASKEEQLKYEEQRYRSCRRCQTFKPSRAHHCSICERCVVKMDHHCPWVNNCVGLGNHKFFLLFIFYVFLMSAYALVLILWRYMDCMQRTQCPQDGAVLVILLTVEGVLFGLFTLCMMCDQYSVITTGATQIDRLKGEVVETEGIREVFGGLSNKPTISWFLPVEIWFPSSMKHQILGYALWSPKEEEEASEQDPFIQDGESGSVSSSTPSTTVTKETLEGGWLVEKHVDAPPSDVQIV